MCGIAGIVDFSGAPIDLEILAKMTRRLAHRGPDGERTKHESLPGRASVGFGHRRLAVIDLETGAQPLSNEDGTVFVVFNGEIYNFRELRARLKGLGHRFTTRSDTEVLVHGYESFGAEIVERLDGMFAFALWDRARERLLMARDPAGKKPLFYTRRGSCLYFGSEPKALDPAIRLRPDLGTIPEYLVLGSVAGARTAFEGVEALPPGHLAVLDGNGLTTRRYWDLPTAKSNPRRERFDEDALLRLVREAVEKRLVADVPIGALLSGGIDSSLVVKAMADVAGEVHTFTVGLEDEAFDESAHAREVARVFGTVHHELHVRAHVEGVFERIIDTFDEPFADSSALPTFLVSEFARKHVTVVLTGDGGDELLAGYPRLSLVARLERVPRSVSSLAAKIARAFGPSPHHGRRRAKLLRLSERSALPLPERLLSLISVFREDQLELLVRSLSDAHPGARVFDEVSGRARSGGALDRVLFLNFHTYLPDDLLEKVDRASMAVGLETRAPLLDKALIEHAFALPDDAKVDGSLRKVGLRRILARLAPELPPVIMQRPKQGFGLPLGRWFRAELEPVARAACLGESGPLHKILSSNELARIFNAHQDQRKDWGHGLWALLVLDRWLRRYAPELVS